MAHTRSTPARAYERAPSIYVPRNPTGAERRKYGRRLVRVPFVSWSANATAVVPSVGSVPVMVRDVSLEGVRLYASVLIEMGTEFMLQVPIIDRLIEMPCLSVYAALTSETVGERLYIHGCRFVGFRPGDAQNIAACAWL